MKDTTTTICFAMESTFQRPTMRTRLCQRDVPVKPWACDEGPLKVHEVTRDFSHDGRHLFLKLDHPIETIQAVRIPLVARLCGKRLYFFCRKATICDAVSTWRRVAANDQRRPCGTAFAQPHFTKREEQSAHEKLSDVLRFLLDSGCFILPGLS